MRFKIDENLPIEVAGLLEQDGHEVLRSEPLERRLWIVEEHRIRIRE